MYSVRGEGSLSCININAAHYSHTLEERAEQTASKGHASLSAQLFLSTCSSESSYFLVASFIG